MRDIEFRGKSVTTGKWVFGFYITYSKFEDGITDSTEINRTTIKRYDGGDIENVYPKTVGEFTGMLVKNGNKMFEGDIIKAHYANAKNSDFVEIIVFKDGKFMAESKLGKTGKHWSTLPDGIQRVHFHFETSPVYMEYCEVINNIHDNTEILYGIKEE